MKEPEGGTVMEAFEHIIEQCRKSYRSRTGLEWWIGALLSAPFILMGFVLIVAIKVCQDFQEVMRTSKREQDKRNTERAIRHITGRGRNANIRKQQSGD